MNELVRPWGNLGPNFFHFPSGFPNPNERNKDFMNLRKKKMTEYLAGLSRSMSGTF